MTLTLAWLFGVDGHLTTAQECARTVVVFAYGFALIRIAGRRLFGKWSAVDITVSIIIGSNLSRTITGNAPLVGTMVASALLMALHWLVAHIAARSRRASAFLEGTPIDLVSAGTVNEGERRRHNISYADLDEALRGSGVDRIEDASRVTLEPSGKITLGEAAR